MERIRGAACYVGTTCLLYMLTISDFFDFQFVFSKPLKKVSRVLVCFSIFYYSKKWFRETVLSLV